MGIGGLPCVALTLEELTGLEIGYAGLMTFTGVAQLSTAVGGVEVSEVSVVGRPRRSGRSKDGVLRGWRGIFDLMVLRFVRRHHHRPGRFFWGLGSFTLGLGFVAPMAFFASGLGVEDFVAHTAVLAVTIAAISLAMVLFSLGLVADLLVFLLRSPSTAVLRTRDSYYGSDAGPLGPKEGSPADSRA